MTLNSRTRSRRASGTASARGLLLVAGVSVATACFCSLPDTSLAGDDSPKMVVDRMASQVLAVLRDGSLDSAEKRRRVEEIADTNVDFETLSQLVLARNWRRFSDPQRVEFCKEFKKHLSVTYGDNVDNYRNERVEILGDRQEARGDVTVHTKIIRGGADDFPVDYRLRQREAQWRVIDVIVEGVSLVSNFRSQFQEIISNGGPERLLRLLREKNARGEPLAS